MFMRRLYPVLRTITFLTLLVALFAVFMLRNTDIFSPHYQEWRMLLLVSFCATLPLFIVTINVRFAAYTERFKENTERIIAEANQATDKDKEKDALKRLAHDESAPNANLLLDESAQAQRKNES